MRFGRIYDIDEEWALVIAEGCPGLNGASCLTPVDEPKPVEPAKKPAKGPGRPPKA